MTHVLIVLFDINIVEITNELIATDNMCYSDTEDGRLEKRIKMPFVMYGWNEFPIHIFNIDLQDMIHIKF